MSIWTFVDNVTNPVDRFLPSQARVFVASNLTYLAVFSTIVELTNFVTVTFEPRFLRENIEFFAVVKRTSNLNLHITGSLSFILPPVLQDIRYDQQKTGPADTLPK